MAWAYGFHNYWQRVMQEVHNNIMSIITQRQDELLVSRRDERPIVSAKKWGMPRLSWKGDSLVIGALGKKDLLN